MDIWYHTPSTNEVLMKWMFLDNYFIHWNKSLNIQEIIERNSALESDIENIN